MKKLELPPRLRAIAEQVPVGTKFADIGTDHAYLPIWLLRQGRISSAIATDLREGPLSRGRQAAKDWNVAPRISFRCCNGLEGLGQGEMDTIVIAGMGGETIAAILDGVEWSRSPGLTYLLQPMSSIPDLRDWLQQNGFCINGEKAVTEVGRYYVILTVRSGIMPPLTPGELWAGRQNREENHGERSGYLDDLIARLERAITGMEQAVSACHLHQLEQMRETLRELYQIREEWLSWQR